MEPFQSLRHNNGTSRVPKGAVKKFFTRSVPSADFGSVHGSLMNACKEECTRLALQSDDRVK